MSEATNSPRGTGAAPYGPMTPRVRQFLVRFAGLGASARAAIVQLHGARVDTAAYVAAETALADTIARSGRTTERDALAGPLLQLVRTTPQTADDAGTATAADIELDPIAEPALAALLALLVSDLLAADHVTTLTAPFAELL